MVSDPIHTSEEIRKNIHNSFEYYPTQMKSTNTYFKESTNF